ncbi:MAG: hypothetical protein UW79_C0028G0001 [Candidatus Yanofskybacteria bacterium GW2011_GWA2_44_9]|uniref:Uncharacterized protein n=1 Tax=Candidatus Yanofskybacteria bacterium GW2011_GWA2_44_9 TaxID=1619025 RepID=A0A0G1KBB0_9BACT|nr:MAG: hypothetical protein UW79_C0028G0001 [Candidatus Yanofskybacteria bacterium GW2011_GWA2_44_9]
MIQYKQEVLPTVRAQSDHLVSNANLGFTSGGRHGWKETPGDQVSNREQGPDQGSCRSHSYGRVHCTWEMLSRPYEESVKPADPGAQQGRKGDQYDRCIAPIGACGGGGCHLDDHRFFTSIQKTRHVRGVVR